MDLMSEALVATYQADRLEAGRRSRCCGIDAAVRSRRQALRRRILRQPCC